MSTRTPARAERRASRDRAAAQRSVADRLDALDRVVAAGTGRLDPALLDPARALVRRGGERLRLSGEHTVVALAGATGSGKSSLFNALAGTAVSTVGVRRPTTGVAHAVVWGSGDEAGPLLDWLAVPRRHVLPAGAADPLHGLVLLDLPDHDSTEAAHRVEVDRLVQLVDVLVWVLDPQKYADAAIHDRYLRPLAGHRDVMVVVLNQADRLPPDGVRATLADVRRLLVEDGLVGTGDGGGAVPVLATSTVAPGGLHDLRAVLLDAVAARRAALARIAADLDGVTARLGAVVGGAARSGLDRTAVRALTEALAQAAGVPVVGQAVQRATVQRAVTATGWPVTRWAGRLRPDPLRRLHLDGGSGGAAAAGAAGRSGTASSDGALDTAARTSLPAATPVQRSRVDLALRTLADSAAGGLPDPWPDAVRSAARSREADLPDALDRAVAATDLGVARTPLWWRAVGALQALLAVVAVAGGLWLVALYGFTLLRLPEPPTPDVGAVPLPTLLLVGGVVAGVLLAVLARVVAGLGARRRRARAEARLREAVSGVAEELVLDPVRAELAAYGELRAAVGELRG